MRKEYEYLKCIHRLGEYSLAKGERIYQPGEKLYCEKLKAVVTIMELSENGFYLCEYYTAEDTYHAKKLLSPATNSRSYRKKSPNLLFYSSFQSKTSWSLPSMGRTDAQKTAKPPTDTQGVGRGLAVNG